jgi:cytosine/adenosine deaminase-related metal-dependent hydrolase
LYRKISGTILFNGMQQLPKGTVLIARKDGTIADLVPESEAGDDLEQYAGIICPGLINAHCHIELSHLKGRIPRYSGLCAFVEQVMRTRNEASGSRAEAMEAACSRMEQEGIVAVGDICNSADSLSLKQNSRLYWHNFIEVSGMDPHSVTGRLATMQAIVEKFQYAFAGTAAEKHSGSPGISLTPHSPYSVAPELFQEINRRTGRQLLSLHNQESDEENKLYRDKSGELLQLYERLGIDMRSFRPTGKSSVQSVLPHFNSIQKMLLVHNCFTDREDLEFIRRHSGEGFIGEVSFCICPNANLYISNILPPIRQLREAGAQICIGTDSLAGNAGLSLVAEMRTIQQNHPEIPRTELLQWATYNGARALDIDGEKGQFKKGTRPGIVHIRLDEGGIVSEGTRIL